MYAYTAIIIKKNKNSLRMALKKKKVKTEIKSVAAPYHAPRRRLF